jgi:hypothetical protein|nr:MAG TPA: vWA domain-containing protein [Caudoviricetes sp.]
MERPFMTRAEIEDLMRDWFDRDGETFIRISDKDRVGWEDTLDAGADYSTYILESPTQEDLIRRGYTLASEMLTAMNLPRKVRLRISRTGDSATDLKTVTVCTEYFDDKTLTVGAKLDIFMGLTIHEGCHVLYTTPTKPEDFGVNKRIIHTLWNIIEDERIEEKLGETKPGFARFLEKSRYYYFDQYYLDAGMIDEVAEKTDAEQLLNLILRIIRYPVYLKEEDFERFGFYLKKIKEILLPFPDSTKAALDAAKRIYEVIRDFYRDKETADSKEASYGEGDTDAEGMGSSCGDEELDRKIASDASEMLEGLSKLTGSETADSKEAKTLGDDDMATTVKDKGGLLGEICEGLVELGSGTDTYFTPAPSDASRYEKSHQRVRRYVPAISKIIRGHCREYKLIHRSMRSGVLDTNKLAEAIQGVSTVYIREGEVKSDRVAVCVLIDESGSMRGERIEAAQDTVVLLNEAVGSIPQVELFIYGHTGDIRTSRSTELHVYREKGYSPKYALGSVRACCENRDGIAIYEVAQRVRKQTQLPVLFFILSDGAPCAGSYHGESAMNHVREMVNKVEAMQFNVVQVCINHSYPPERMFKHFVILEDLSTLAISLGRVIKKATMKNTASRVI